MVAIFLLLQIVTNNSFAEELVKMPRLFTHYFHHAEEKRDVHDFLDFLQQHYSNHNQEESYQKQHAGEDDDDCNLPFKHCGNCCLSVHMPLIGFIPNHMDANYSFIQISEAGFLIENDRVESLNICTIWQPPKFS